MGTHQFMDQLIKGPGLPGSQCQLKLYDKQIAEAKDEAQSKCFAA